MADNSTSVKVKLKVRLICVTQFGKGGFMWGDGARAFFCAFLSYVLPPTENPGPARVRSKASRPDLARDVISTHRGQMEQFMSDTTLHGARTPSLTDGLQRTRH